MPMPRLTPNRLSFWVTFAIFAALCSRIKMKAAKGSPRVVLQFHDVGGCKEGQTPFEFKNSSIGRSKLGNNVISCDFYNHKLAKSFSKVEVAATKCTDAVSFNTCEYEGTLKFAIGLCQMMAAKNMPWSTMFETLQPKPNCPLQTGAYVLRNATVDMDSVVKFVGAGFIESSFGKIYIADFRAFDDKNKMHVCFTTKFSFMRIRSQR